MNAAITGGASVPESLALSALLESMLRIIYSSSLQQIARTWPEDKLRPNIQFSQVLQFLSESPALDARSVAAARALSTDRVRRQVRRNIYSPFSDTEKKLKFGLSEKMLAPPSSPEHYSRLVENVDKCSWGQRSWIERFFAL